MSDIKDSVALIVQHALHEAAKKLEESIARCDGLSSPDAKQTDKAKEYFAELSEDYKAAVKVIHGLGRGI